jgi:hypothetical protein
MMVCRAVYKANCYHRKGHDAECGVYTTTYMVVFGVVQIFFSQLPNFHDLECGCPSSPPSCLSPIRLSAPAYRWREQ